jgi:hypothetical protein
LTRIHRGIASVNIAELGDCNFSFCVLSLAPRPSLSPTLRQIVSTVGRKSIIKSSSDTQLLLVLQHQLTANMTKEDTNHTNLHKSDTGDTALAPVDESTEAPPAVEALAASPRRQRSPSDVITFAPAGVAGSVTASHKLFAEPSNIAGRTPELMGPILRRKKVVSMPLGSAGTSSPVMCRLCRRRKKETQTI